MTQSSIDNPSVDKVLSSSVTALLSGEEYCAAPGGKGDRRVARGVNWSTLPKSTSPWVYYEVAKVEEY